jgi:uncharacterized protein YjbI with pentapeptide repeats
MAMRCGRRRCGVGTTPAPAAGVTSWRLPLLAAFAVVSVAIAAPAPASANDGTTVEPEDFVELVAEGLDHRGVTVTGDVDLRDLRRVDQLVRCIDCTIEGDLSAADVTFERVVDLDGLVVTGSLDLHGATADSSLVLSRAVVHGPADLSHVAIGGQVVFDRAELRGPALFDGFRTAGATSFVDATFRERVTFTSCDVRGTTTFAGADLHGEAAFTRCEFARPVSFREATFDEEAAFGDAIFASASDFTLSNFEAGAVVDRARFRGPASFRLASIGSTLSLQHTRAEQDLDLQAVTGEGDLDLHSATVYGLLQLTDVILTGEGELDLERVAARGLLMDVESIDDVRGDTVRRVVLQRLEETAKQGNDLGVANEARYALLSRNGGDLGGAMRILDQVFYRGAAGYLVRPSHPLMVLLVVLLLAGITRTTVDLGAQQRASRTLAGERSDGERRQRRRDQLREAGPAFVRGFGATLRLAFRRRPGITVDQGSTRSQVAAAGVMGEFLLCKTLFVLIVLAIGNSSPTFREVLDALRA